MNTLLIIIIVVVVLLIGFFDILHKLRKLIKKLDFAGEFLESYTTYINSQGSNEESYVWLTLNAEKMQNQLGSSGVMNYKMPGSFNFIPNYPIVLNLLPEIKREFSREYIISRENFNFTINTLRETILRHIGFLDNYREELVTKLKNPIIWFREGINAILLLPILLLNQFGILSNRFYYKIKKSILFKIIVAIVALLGFLSSIFTVVLGWEKFISLIQRFL